MTQSNPSSTATLDPATLNETAEPAKTTPSTFSDVAMLTKLRLNSMVIVTTAVGFAMAGAATQWAGWSLFFHVLLGTAFCSAAGGVLNQWLERDVDGLMKRTKNRPLPSGRFEAHPVLWFGALLAILGVVHLGMRVNALAAGVAFATILIYALLYTPLKRMSPTSTVVGAVPGALPPLIGWAGATGSLDLRALTLFGIIFCWQLPHFLAIAWSYKDDYRAAGMPMLPVIDETGKRTARSMFVWSVALVFVSLAPTVLGMAGVMYAAVAAVFGLYNLHLALKVTREKTRESARRLFFYSLLHLPVLFGSMVLDAFLWSGATAG